MKILRASVVLALSVLYLSYVFQFATPSPRESGLGDWIDPYFINYLLEHWYHSLLTFSDPASPLMYFPARGTLGYSHGLILFAPFYVAVRPFLHPFHAYTVSLFLVMETGCLCLYALLRRCVRLGFFEALLLTAFFVSSPNVVQASTAVWSQRASVFLIPAILLIVLTTVQMPPGRSKLVLSWVSGLLPALLFVQDFYTGQFALLVSVLLLAGGLLLAPVRARLTRAVLSNTAVSVWRAPVIAAEPSKPPSRWWLVAAGVALASAIAIEVHPVSRTNIAGWRMSADQPGRGFLLAALTGGWFVFRRWQVLARATRTWTQVRPGPTTSGAGRRFNPYWLAAALGAGAGSLLFVWIYLGPYREHPSFAEEMLTRSLTPFEASAAHGLAGVLRSVVAYDSARSFALVLMVGALAWLPWFRIDRATRVYSLWFVCVSAVILAVPLRFGDFSVWKSVFRLFPGSSVIRDPKRVIEVYELVAVLAVGLFLARLPTTSALRRALPLAVLTLLAADWNPEVFPYGRPIAVYRQMVEAPIQIDPSCRSFFIKGASDRYMARSGHMWSLYGIDAMFIAIDHAMPTLNGYSAWEPAGWGLANPQEPAYPGRVSEWIERHDLQGVCALDIEARSMTPYGPVPAPR